MQFHDIQPNHAGQKPKRIGRGGKRGTYSGRGIKGLLARAGGKRRPEERETLKKIPKLRGYKFRSFRPRPVVINLSLLEKHFTEGEKITPKVLLEKGIIHRKKGKMPQIKILGGGDGKKKFIFKEVLFSKTVGDRMGTKHV